jgi:L-iditol 2-dehydrogenase
VSSSILICSKIFRSFILKKIEILESKSFAIKEVENPTLKENEVLVKVNFIALCGSDLHLYEGTYGGPKNYPITFGHEWSGEVVTIGSKVKKFQIGDNVTGDCSKYCGECDNCKIDKNLCLYIEKFGITIDGASAEFIVREERYLYKFEESLDSKLAALTEPISVSANLIARVNKISGSFKNKKVLVLGLGGIGLGAIFILKNYYNCQTVYATDISVKRKGIAQKMGAEIVQIDARKREDNYGNLYLADGYDVIIETTGSKSVFPTTLELINPHGVIGCLGMLPAVEIPQKLIVLKAITLLGSIGGTGSFETVLDLIKKFPEQVKHIISHILPVVDNESLIEAFHIAENSDESVKVLLDISKI